VSRRDSTLKANTLENSVTVHGEGSNGFVQRHVCTALTGQVSLARLHPRALPSATLFKPFGLEFSVDEGSSIRLVAAGFADA